MARKRMDPKLWWAIKTMLKSDEQQKVIAEYFSISENVVYIVNKSESFEDYKQIQAAMHAKWNEKKKAEEREKKAANENPAPVTEVSVKPAEKPVVHNVTIQATHYMMQELQEQNKLLKEISAKLAFIVEQLA